jgi:acetyl esterase/lipase
MNSDNAKTRKWLRKFLLLIGWIAIGWGFGGILLDNLHPYNLMRHQAQQDVGIERLQQWANSQFDNPPAQFSSTGPQRSFRRKDLPQLIRQLADGCYVVYEPRSSDSAADEHILFACGGGFYHYGLRVGRRRYKPEPSNSFTYEKLGEGVWGMYE